MKAKTHKTITRLAIELCSEQLSDTMCKNRESIIQGSSNEDHWYEPKRALNWHFYRAKESPIPQRVRKLLLSCKPTSEEILRERILEMEGYGRADKRRYERLGRVLHHIQDMSTPSHVLPIYHGPDIEDYFETFVEEHDCKITSNHLVSPTSIEGETTLEKIYHDAAAEMLKHLSEDGFDVVNGETTTHLPYSLFWKHYTEEEYGKIKGFGVYDQRHNYFVDKNLLENNPHGISRQTLLSIQEQVTGRAIVNTCRALMLADK